MLRTLQRKATKVNFSKCNTYNAKHPIQIARYAKKRGGQETVTHSAEKNQSTEPDPEITERANKQLL